MEVLFAVIGELLLLHSIVPSALSWSGMGLVMVGMVLQSYLSNKMLKPKIQNVSA
jgi:ABC-type Fe3+-siderophore transport system permease subunit